MVQKGKLCPLSVAGGSRRSDLMSIRLWGLTLQGNIVLKGQAITNLPTVPVSSQRCFRATCNV